VIIHTQASAVAVHLSTVDKKRMRLYSTLVVMVCSGMLAPDPFTCCDVHRRGDVWRMSSNIVAQSR
jgi:hypothetical protein